MQKPKLRLKALSPVLFVGFWGFTACSKPPVIDAESAALRVTATSALQDSKVKDRYAAEKLTDGTLESWCEGAPGDGVGEKLRLSFTHKATGKPAVVRVKKLFVRNGFGTAAYYLQNGRVWHMAVKAGKWATHVQLRDTAEPQEVEFADTFEADSMELTVDKVYPGSKYHDTCLTEISLVPLQGTVGAAVIEPFSEASFRFPSGRQFHLKSDQKVAGDLCSGCQLSQPIVNGTWKKEPGIIRIEFSYKKPSDGCAGGDNAQCSESIMDGDIVLRQASRAGVTDTEGNSGTVLEWKD